VKRANSRNRLLTRGALFAAFAVVLIAATGGHYSGIWTSDSGANSGKLNITIGETGEGDLTFFYQDQAIKPKKVTAKVAGNQVEFLCDLDLDGLKLKTTFSGKIEGKNMSGKYQSTSAEDGSMLDSGTWKAALQ
jgi:hypothetical protein